MILTGLHGRKRSSEPSRTPWQHLYSLWHAEQCSKDQTDDKQPPMASARISRSAMWNWSVLTASNTWEQSSLMKGSNLKYLPDQPRPQLPLQNWRPYGMTRNIVLRSKIRLMHSLVISIFLYACEFWTLTAELERRIQAMEMRCFRKLLGITYRVNIWFVTLSM